jgi:hypothetical protein
MSENLLDLENLLVIYDEIDHNKFCIFFLEVYEGTYRKARVAIKVLKEPTSASLFLHEADIMR